MLKYLIMNRTVSRENRRQNQFYPVTYCVFLSEYSDMYIYRTSSLRCTQNRYTEQINVTFSWYYRYFLNTVYVQIWNHLVNHILHLPSGVTHVCLRNTAVPRITVSNRNFFFFFFLVWNVKEAKTQSSTPPPPPAVQDVKKKKHLKVCWRSTCGMSSSRLFVIAVGRSFWPVGRHLANHTTAPGVWSCV